jgi:hypothetical protein
MSKGEKNINWWIDVIVKVREYITIYLLKIVRNHDSMFFFSVDNFNCKSCGELE